MDNDTVWAKGAYAGVCDDGKWSIRIISTNGQEDWISELHATFFTRQEAESVILDAREVLGPLISIPVIAKDPTAPEGTARP